MRLIIHVWSEPHEWDGQVGSGFRPYPGSEDTPKTCKSSPRVSI